MKRKIKKISFVFFSSICLSPIMNAQDLEPRAYVRVPINMNLITAGYSYSKGGVVTDPTLPLQNLEGKISMFSAGFVHSFNLFGLTAQALAAIPYFWINASALYNGQPQTASRSGIGDMRFRISILFLGAPGAKLREFVKQKPKTVLAGSLTILAPTGVYNSNHLINVGSGRWALKPELAFSQPLGNRWLFDLYAGVWFYTNNDAYFPGNALRSQSPVGAFQAHGSYTVKPNLWAAFDVTYYAGGNATINGRLQNARLSNVRYGATIVLPTIKKSSLKLAFSTGAYVLAGTNFTTFSIGWSYLWVR
jgi:Putative MetA-pathway of phenol degradation